MAFFSTGSGSFLCAPRPGMLGNQCTALIKALTSCLYRKQSLACWYPAGLSLSVRLFCQSKHVYQWKQAQEFDLIGTSFVVWERALRMDRVVWLMECKAIRKSNHRHVSPEGAGWLHNVSPSKAHTHAHTHTVTRSPSLQLASFLFHSVNLKFLSLLFIFFPFYSEPHLYIFIARLSLMLPVAKKHVKWNGALSINSTPAFCKQSAPGAPVCVCTKMKKWQKDRMPSSITSGEDFILPNITNLWNQLPHQRC